MLIFDSSTLILTAKIELLDAFLKDVGMEMEVAIPRAVADECCGGKKTLDALIIRKVLDEFRIRVRSVGTESWLRNWKRTSVWAEENQKLSLSLCKRKRCSWGSTTKMESMPANWLEFHSRRPQAFWCEAIKRA